MVRFIQKLSLVVLKKASLDSRETNVINGIQRGKPSTDVNTALFFNPLDRAVVKVNNIAKEQLPSMIESKIKPKFSTGLPNHILNTKYVSKEIKTA
jgi:hypothetical protein